CQCINASLATHLICGPLTAIANPDGGWRVTPIARTQARREPDSERDAADVPRRSRAGIDRYQFDCECPRRSSRQRVALPFRAACREDLLTRSGIRRAPRGLTAVQRTVAWFVRPAHERGRTGRDARSPSHRSPCRRLPSRWARRALPRRTPKALVPAQRPQTAEQPVMPAD